MEGAKRGKLFGAKSESENGETTEKRLEAPTQKDMNEESAAIEREIRKTRVTAWGSVRLRGGEIEQPWHERLRRIRGDRDPRF